MNKEEFQDELCELITDLWVILEDEGSSDLEKLQFITSLLEDYGEDHYIWS